MKKPKTGKTMTITFCPDIQESRTVFEYELRPVNRGGIIENPQKMFKRQNVDFTKLSLNHFTGRNFCFISFLNQEVCHKILSSVLPRQNVYFFGSYFYTRTKIILILSCEMCVKDELQTKRNKTTSRTRN